MLDEVGVDKNYVRPLGLLGLSRLLDQEPLVLRALVHIGHFLVLLYVLRLCKLGLGVQSRVGLRKVHRTWQARLLPQPVVSVVIEAKEHLCIEPHLLFALFVVDVRGHDPFKPQGLPVLQILLLNMLKVDTPSLAGGKPLLVRRRLLHFSF